MNEKEQRLAKSFAQMGEVYEFIKSDLLSFGILDTEGATDAEIGARYKVREAEIKRLKLRFQKYEQLVD